METPFKPNNQVNFIIISLKLVMIAIIMLNFNNLNYIPLISFGFYHFMCLYGTLCYSIASVYEYKRTNYFFTIIGILGIITYQPFYSVLKIDVNNGLVDTEEIIFQLTVVINFLWVICDIIRWIRDVSRFKRILTNQS